ncbi:hypothetical protein [Stigmatella aurantiaca]|uniref:hypothetical protein n=1 Tax=Stigmatella aurantiaca TaxID=41 RepID=UPI00055E3704|nr:hypothetical protein [Stigmatella aurantiaca]
MREPGSPGEFLPEVDRQVHVVQRLAQRVAAEARVDAQQGIGGPQHPEERGEQVRREPDGHHHPQHARGGLFQVHVLASLPGVYRSEVPGLTCRRAAQRV